MITYLNKTTNWFEGFLLRLDEVKGWKVLVGMVVAAILYHVTAAIILEELLNVELKNTGLEVLPLPDKFTLAVIAAPIFETLIFQFLIIEVICYFLPERKLLALIVSSLLFAFSHAYSNAYILFALVPGLVLGMLYLTFRNRDNSPIMVVCLAHALINLYALLHNEVLSAL